MKIRTLRLSIIWIIIPFFSYGSVSLHDRIEYHSRELLGRAYGDSPLGEGNGYDSDPLIRFDLFDCTTFVETVLALSLSDIPGVNKAPVEILNSIRYKSEGSEISFVNRTHFTSADWIPNLMNKNIIQDITVELFKENSVQFVTEIDRQAWFQTSHQIHVPIAKQVVILPVVELKAFKKNAKLWDLIPSGSLINFVGHPSTIKAATGTDMDVRHQGIAIRRDGELFLRHAKSTGRGVVEEKITNAFKHPYLIHVHSINVLRPTVPQR